MHQFLETRGADVDRPVEAGRLTTAKFPKIRPVVVDANHQPPIGKRTQSHENRKKNRDRHGKADWCSHTDPVSCDIPSERSGCYGSSNPSKEQQLKHEMMHPELPVRPEHAKR